MALPGRDRTGGSMVSPPTSLTSEMNVTPMLDVMLVLLIIFMTALSARIFVDAHLPDPSAVPSNDAVPIVLEVGANGYFAINRQVVPAADLPARLEALYTGRPDKRIILQGERAARYQEIITAMDIARGAGVTVIGVEMRPRLDRSGSTAVVVPSRNGIGASR